MLKSMMNSNFIKNIKISLINLPTPININIWWNFGSILGLFLFIQIITGLFLSMHYCANTDYAFKSIIHIIQDVKYGWLMRNAHVNGASFYFMCMYVHISRNIFFSSFNQTTHTWQVGITIFLISMMTAFMGYVLPWGQMSFWGATVITNLLSAIPYLGNLLTIWIWGGFSVSNPTLNRFYSFHFILPFIILFMVLIHLMLLHHTGSSSPLGSNNKLSMISFHIYHSIKDSLGFIIILMIYLIIILEYPYMFSDPDNFTPANPMITPVHIQPEWYFLFAYAILRSIPNKLGGVIALLMSILILYFLPLMKKNKFHTLTFYPISQLSYWLFISAFIILTWSGAQPIEVPFTIISQIYSMIYFIYFFTINFLNKFWDYLLFKLNFIK